MSDDLIKRLRDFGHVDAYQAANIIEQLVATCEELEAKLDKAVVALRNLIHHTHNCEKELTEKLHHQDFCGESLPLTNARAVLAELEGKE
jgi:hypothetical protein